MKCDTCQIVIDLYDTQEFILPRHCKCHLVRHTSECKSVWMKTIARHVVYYCECPESHTSSVTNS